MEPLIVYLLLGAQGSGKTTWAAAHAGCLGAVVLASDAIRNELEAQGVPAAPEGDRVFALLEARLAAWLAQGQSVLVDATHARRAWRAKEIAIARARGARRVAIWFHLPLAVCLQRNARKPGTRRWGERVIAPAEIQAVYRGFEPPTSDEFDEIRVIGVRPSPLWVVSPVASPDLRRGAPGVR
jgi:predicted kinase